MARVVPKEESRLVLRADGRWWHDGEPATHDGLCRFFHRQIRKDGEGRYYLYNSIDVPEVGRTLEEHVYFDVEDTAYFVESVAIDGGSLDVRLNTGSWERVDPALLTQDEEGRVYCRLGSGDEAAFGRHATMQLAPFLVECDGGLGVEVGGRARVIRSR